MRRFSLGGFGSSRAGSHQCDAPTSGGGAKMATAMTEAVQVVDCGIFRLEAGGTVEYSDVVQVWRYPM